MKPASSPKQRGGRLNSFKERKLEKDQRRRLGGLASLGPRGAGYLKASFKRKQKKETSEGSEKKRKLNKEASKG